MSKADDDNMAEDLNAAYRDMAEDESREAEALEWAEATIFSWHSPLDRPSFDKQRLRT